MADFDLLIRSGTVGGATRAAEADGALVSPDFVDIHSHYEGQATWDEQLVPSWDDVTTTVMGNCGVGFAPCRSEDRGRLIELMECVEDIPGTALHGEQTGTRPGRLVRRRN